MSKLLLVLDLDETLISSTFNNSAFGVIDDIKTYQKPPSLIWKDYYVFLRPFVTEFLDYCLKHFHVAVWTASGSEYANKIVDLLFNERKKELKFVYTREDTLQRKKWEIYSSPTTESIKQLVKVEKIGFSLKRTLIIDDNYSSYCQNINNAIPIRSWKGNPKDKDLLLLKCYLEKNFENTPVKDVRFVNKYNWIKPQFL